jgi:aspartate 4-decarboxylase
MMSLFSLFEMMDKEKRIRPHAWRSSTVAAWAMFEALGLAEKLSINPNYDAYYGLID